jgi:AcrR family transcriptional regulator
VPKIAADTLAEHVDRQRQRVFQAAVSLFLERGYEQVTFADIAGEVGLARNSLYRYFPGKAAILAAWIENELDESSHRAELILNREGTVTDRVFAWAEDQVGFGRRPEHALLVSFASASSDLDPATLENLRNIHRRMSKTLTDTIEESGSGDRSDLIARLIQGLVNQASAAPPDRDDELLPLLRRSIDSLLGE